MKSLLISTVTFLFIATTVIGQNEIDSLHRPRNFDIKVEQFRGYSNAKDDIIFLGNSITAGVNWNELLNLNQAKNRGISGDTTFGILERLDEVTEGKPAKVFILIGINDIARNYTDAVIIKNYKRIITQIKKESPQTEIFLQTILPVNNTFDRYPNHYNKDEHILNINENLREIAKNDESVKLIDLHPKFLDDNQRLKTSFTEEGLHLNAAAYKHWAGILKPYLEE